MNQPRIRLTAPQLRALFWLPADGKWSGKLSRVIERDVNSLAHFHPSLTKMRANPFRPRGGQSHRARLTVAGITERRFREAEARGWTAPDLSGETT